MGILMARCTSGLFVLAVLFVGLAASGCSQNKQISGRPILDENVSKIIDGKTTTGEVLALFGAPTDRTQLGNEDVFIYKYSRSAGEGLAVPYFSKSKTQERVDELTIVFDKDTGIVKHHGLKRGIGANDEVG